MSGCDDGERVMCSGEGSGKRGNGIGNERVSVDANNAYAASNYDTNGS